MFYTLPNLFSLVSFLHANSRNGHISSLSKNACRGRRGGPVHFFLLALPRISLLRHLLACWGRETGAMPIKCMICLGSDGTYTDSMCATRCGHVFHRDCLVRWISRYGYGTCVSLSGVQFYCTQPFHRLSFLVISFICYFLLWAIATA
jgi:hypothetical protein